MIGTRPLLSTLVSPDLAKRRADPAHDELPAQPPASAVSPTSFRRPNQWDMSVMRRWAADLPCPTVARLGLECCEGVLNPFKGDLSKAVWYPPHRLTAVESDACWASFMKEVAKGNTLGPFPYPPFASCRQCPFFPVPKKKHEPLNPAVRVCCHFSKGGTGSVNSLCDSYGLISVHASASMIRDAVCELGSDGVVWAADIPACFRRQNICEALLPLFVYCARDPDGSWVWFQDLAHAFGWTPAEWGWQCILTIIMWHLRRVAPGVTLGYVDNFYDFMSRARAVARRALLEATFAEAGIPLHEIVFGQLFPGLGWLWDVGLQTMTCPLDKYTIFCAYLAAWQAATVLSVAQLETAVGLFSWASAGLSTLGPCVAPLIHARTSVKRLAELSASGKSCVLRKSPDVCDAINFAVVVFNEWDRVCPVFLDFGPTAMWECLGRCDAALVWGCGGFVFDGGPALRGFMHKWSAAELALAHVDVALSTTVLELLGSCYWARFVGPSSRGLRVQLEMDCAPAVIDIQKAFSAKPAVLACVTEFRLVCARAGMHVRTRHVLAEIFNKIADALSRDDRPQACLLSMIEFGLPLEVTVV